MIKKIKCWLGFHNLIHIKTLNSGHMMCGVTMTPYLKDISKCKICNKIIETNLILPTPKNITWYDLTDGEII